MVVLNILMITFMVGREVIGSIEERIIERRMISLGDSGSVKM